MSIADVMADQWRLPRAPLAEVAARALNHRNGELISQTIDALDVHARHKVLDVGFGGGLSLRLLLHKARGGQVCGVDPSVDMVNRAGRLLGNDLASGRLALQVGEANALPYGPEEFDRVLTCQTVYFWSDVCGGLAELHRVLAPGGSCAVAMIPKPLQERFGFPERGYNTLSHAELGDWLEHTGFNKVRRWRPRTGGAPWVVVADKP